MTPALPDFSRHAGLLDNTMLTPVRLGFIGVGGAASLGCDLARCGIRNFVIVDPDVVGPTNPTTQHYDSWDINEAKVLAERDRILRINPDADVIGFAKPYEGLTEDQLAIFWASDMALAMTDNFYTQDLIHKDALRYKALTTSRGPSAPTIADAPGDAPPF